MAAPGAVSGAFSFAIGIAVEIWLLVPKGAVSPGSRYDEELNPNPAAGIGDPTVVHTGDRASGPKLRREKSESEVHAGRTVYVYQEHQLRACKDVRAGCGCSAFPIDI